MSPLYAILVMLPAVTMAINLKPYNETAHNMFIVNDLNADGLITRNEIDIIFQQYDANGDGRVSRHEYTDFQDNHSPEMNALSHAMYDIYDVNGDHHLDKPDYDNFFSLMDYDANGEVSEDEFIKYWSVLFVSLEHIHGGGK